MKKLFLFLLLPAAVCAQEKDAALVARIKKVENSLSPFVIYGKDSVLPNYNIEERLRIHHVKGISIAVVRNNKVEWARGYGWADSAEGRRVTPETRFQAASISKSLNSMALLKLVQEGKIDPTADINGYLKGWQFPYDSLSKGKKINLYNLLSHSAGLTVHGFGGYERKDSLPSIVQILDGQRPANSPKIRSAFEPGLRFEYSGGGTTISQLMLTSVTGRIYDEYMQIEVLNRLGMTNSSYRQPPKDTANLATGYHINGLSVPQKYHVYPEQAAAGLWTTPTDLSKYIIEVNQCLKGKSSKVLTPAMMRTRLTPYVDSNVALGLFVITRGKSHWFNHNGGNEAFLSTYYGNPETGDGVAIMINGEDFGVVSELLFSVMRSYGWEGPGEPVFRKTVDIGAAELDALKGKYIHEKDTLNAKVVNGELHFHPTRGSDDLTAMFADGDHFWLQEDGGAKCTVKRDPMKKVTSIEMRWGSEIEVWTLLD